MQQAHPSIRRRVILAPHGVPMAVVVTRPEDSSCLAYNSNKDEIYAFDTITEKIPIGSSCNSWSAFSATVEHHRDVEKEREREKPTSRACARAKRFARAPSITRLSGPRQVVTKFPAELTVQRVETYKLSRNVARRSKLTTVTGNTELRNICGICDDEVD